MLDGDQGTLRRYIEKQFEYSAELQSNAVVGNNIQKQKNLNDKKEVFNVRKNGTTQRVKIYPEKNMNKQNEIKKILQKNQCIDLFKDLMVEDQHMPAGEKGYQQFLKYKF